VFRFPTRITGGTPSVATRVPNQTETFAGNLQALHASKWTQYASQTVALYFRPTGSKVWQQAARTTTDANGYYRLSADPGRWSGTWYVGFTAPGA
jgi:hypothetical protein